MTRSEISHRRAIAASFASLLQDQVMKSVATAVGGCCLDS